MLEGLFIAGAAQQMAQANRAQTAGEMASALAATVRTQNEAITADVEKLFLITQALWTILKEEHGYAPGYSEKVFQTITTGITRAQVDKIMCTPLGIGTNRDATVEYGYTCDGKSRIGDFAWFGRGVRFSNDVVVSIESRIYYD